MNPFAILRRLRDQDTETLASYRRVLQWYATPVADGDAVEQYNAWVRHRMKLQKDNGQRAREILEKAEF